MLYATVFYVFLPSVPLGGASRNDGDQHQKKPFRLVLLGEVSRKGTFPFSYLGEVSGKGTFLCNSWGGSLWEGDFSA